MDRAAVRADFDEQVRKNTSPDGTCATFETDGTVVRRLARPGQTGSGVFWSDLNANVADAIIAAQVRAFASRGERFEWKLYSYDQPANLAARLLAAGFVPDEPESLMIGEISEVILALGSASPPAGVTLERVTGLAGVELLTRVHELVFHRDATELRESLRAQISAAPDVTCLVVAKAGDLAVSSARIEFLPGTEFAGLWGGGTLPEWRGSGIYTALVRYRAELATRRDRKYLTVDASEESRPILQRAGFACVATTTPYIWSPG